jgi:RNA polymerase sigma factor (sigma-70 family)
MLGDQQAVKHLPRRQHDLFQNVWLDHAHLVHRLAHKFPYRDTSALDELVAAGMVGLWQAWKNYNPTAGNAGLWGHASTRVLGAMQDHLRLLDLTTRRERDVARLTGREAPKRYATNLDSVVKTPCDQPSALHEIARHEMQAAVLDALDMLPQLHAAILFGRYFEEKRHRDLGRSRGFSESRSCQIEQAALARLREILENDPRLADTIRDLSCYTGRHNGR